jgi:hypothetical protein
MCQCPLNQQVVNEVRSAEWLEKTLTSFNVPGEMEWDICDVCRVHTHIHVAKWTILNNNMLLLCKQCQNNNLC